MQPDELNLEQWQTEIQTFVAETNRQLLELRDQLAMQFAGGTSLNRNEADGSQFPQPVYGPAAVNEQLSSLERLIATRLEHTESGATIAPRLPETSNRNE